MEKTDNLEFLELIDENNNDDWDDDLEELEDDEEEFEDDGEIEEDLWESDDEEEFEDDGESFEGDEESEDDIEEYDEDEDEFDGDYDENDLNEIEETEELDFEYTFVGDNLENNYDETNGLEVDYINNGLDEEESDDSEEDSDDSEEDLSEGSLDEEGFDEEYNEIDNDDSYSFINENGDVQVMDLDEDKDGFELTYLHPDQIIVAERIRSKQSEHLLEDSIKSTGLLMPIVVAPTMVEGKYILISGLRRLLACIKVGKVEIPSIINNKIRTTQIPIVEALYNHGKKYNVSDKLEFIKKLEADRHITSASTIEYILEMETGDYNKLKDLDDDGDEEILTPLFLGSIDISTAYKKLEQRRKKDGTDVREAKKVQGAYSGESETGMQNLEDLGENDYDEGKSLSDEQIKELDMMLNKTQEELEDVSLEDMVEEQSQIKGYEPEVQEVGDRHVLDPAIRKAVMAKYETTCQCCGLGGPSYVDTMDVHHIKPVQLKGPDHVDNLITACLNCHKLIHLYARNQLYIPKSESLSDEEQTKFKKIIIYGGYIRKAIEMSGKSLDEYKKKDGIKEIGRQMPGAKNTVD